MQYPRIMYASLFDAAWDTIHVFSKDEKYLGATAGMISILHTWGQQLKLHPHLHCIVPAGGLNKQGQWKHCKTKGNYLFPVKALSIVFRAKYIHHLRKHVAAHNTNTDKQFVLPKVLIDDCFKQQWVVYAKKPFSGVNSVVEYLSRYSHKVAISNHRITTIDKPNKTVTFSYKDYKNNAVKKQLTLHSMEFIRRFCLHILPKSFVRIRHYGILSSTAKSNAIKKIRRQLPEMKAKKTKNMATTYNHLQCPCCKKESMTHILNFNQRGPPKQWEILSKHLLQNIILN